jgi:imidazolonepropionase-like amidohydrolase
MRIWRALACVCLLQTAVSWGQKTPIVFEHVRVFDGNDVTEDATVVIAQGKIRAMGQSVEVPAGAVSVDGRGKTLLPGLIDAHTHIHGALSLQEAMVFGVTTELDMMMPPRLMQWLREHPSTDQADFRSAGNPATVPGGHGTEYGMPIATLTKPKDAEAFVDARLREGSDYIKIMYGDSRVYGRRIPLPVLDKKTMTAVIAAAHARGKLTVVHIATEQDARDALDAGADGLAHLFVGAMASKDFGRFVAAHHAFVVPTLTVLQSSCSMVPGGEELERDPLIRPWITDGQRVRLDEMRERMPGPPRLSCDGAYEAIRELRDAGVPVLAGTDAPNPGTAHGASLHGEMERLVKAGLTPMEALRGATSEAADVFHLTDRGKIAPGLRADLLLVEGDPTRDIRATRNIVAIYHQGMQVKRQKPYGEGNDGAR